MSKAIKSVVKIGFDVVSLTDRKGEAGSSTNTHTIAHIRIQMYI